MPGSIPASDSSSVSDGMTVGDSFIQAENDGAYADYHINASQAGYYYVDIDMVFSENEVSNATPAVDIYQGKTKLGTAAVSSTDESTAAVRALIKLENTGIQALRLSFGKSKAQIKTITLTKAEESHQIPGKINGADYISASGVTVNHGRAENIGWWGNVCYRITVPEEDDYTFTIYAAAENTAQTGFWLHDCDLSTMESLGELLCLGDGSSIFNGNDGFQISGSRDIYTASSGTVHLAAGEHIIRIGNANTFNIEAIVIGFSASASYEVITEGAEDGKVITVDITGGTLVSDSGASVDGLCNISGLPEGVSASAEKLSDTRLRITLNGNRTKDFDSDVVLKIEVFAYQGNSQNVYRTSAEAVITAVDDVETISLPAEIQAKSQDIMVTLNGGTWNKDELTGISIAGNGADYFTLEKVTYVDETHICLALDYHTVYYPVLGLEITIPKEAYSDSAGGSELMGRVNCIGDTNLPQAIEVGHEAGTVILTESNAYYLSGSLTADTQAGNLVDFLLDVKEAGDYTITYTTTNNGAVNSGLKINGRGSGISIGGNLATMSFTNMWGAVCQVKDTVFLDEGIQTLEFEALASGYTVIQYIIEPKAEPKVIGASQQGEKTVIPAAELFGGSRTASHAIETKNGEKTIGCTVAGTYLDYSVNVQKDGIYKVNYSYCSDSSNTPALALQQVKDKTAETLGITELTPNRSWDKFIDSSQIQVNLSAGEQTLRLLFGTDGANLHSITFELVEAQEKETATVTFVSEGNKVSEVTLDRGHTIDVPEAPKRDGYLFAGWFTEDVETITEVRRAVQSVFNENAPVMADVTVYAGWISLAADSNGQAVFNLEGVQLRQASEGVSAGIRFVTQISVDLIETIKALNGRNASIEPSSSSNKDLGYGTVVTTRNYLANVNEFVKDEYAQYVVSGMVVSPAVNVFKEYTDSASGRTYRMYTAVVTGIPAGSYDLQLAARPYITYYDANGKLQTYYYTENASSAEHAEKGAYCVSYHEVLEVLKR